jgi:hypothetical protein
MAADDGDHPARTHRLTLNASVAGREAGYNVPLSDATAAPVKTMFWLYCVVIVTGLTLYAVVGLTVR